MDKLNLPRILIAYRYLNNFKPFLSSNISNNFLIDKTDNGIEALKLLNKNKYNLIITALLMPVYDGLEILIKSKELHPQTPVIIVSSHANEITIKDLKLAGAHDHLTTPFTLDEITKIIYSH